jgi:hypothetical protein
MCCSLLAAEATKDYYSNKNYKPDIIIRKSVTKTSAHALPPPSIVTESRNVFFGSLLHSMKHEKIV